METALAIVGIVAVFLAVFYLVRNAVVRRKITCPVKKQEVQVDLLRRGFSGEGKALEVKSCSAFEDPRKLDCAQDCIKT